MTGAGGKSRRTKARAGAEAVLAFYRQPLAVAALLLSSLLLSFGGGAVMFYFHAIVRGEQGPAIADAHHWLLDSGLGFVALTPVLAIILPLGIRAVSRASRFGRQAYVLTVAILFTVLTGPGPFLHNQIAGGGTPLARFVTELLGTDAGVAARNLDVHERAPLTEGLLQLAVGLPVYLFFTWLALRALRSAVGFTRRVSAPLS